MNTAAVYLCERFVYRISEFLRHWYIRSARMYSNFVFSRMEVLDQTLAWRITLKNLFVPLYKDYSIIGRIIGFIFRSIRLIVGTIIYAILFSIAILLYFVWVVTPIILFLAAIGY